MKYWLGLGANLGDRLAALQAAVDGLANGGITVEAVSHVYETAPREIEDQPAFLNAACRVATDLEPPALLRQLKRIERALGRVAGPRYGPRAIDLDILLWEGGRWHDARLEIPHPRLVERRFALVPLLDLDRDQHVGEATVAQAAAVIDATSQPVVRVDHALTLPDG